MSDLGGGLSDCDRMLALPLVLGVRSVNIHRVVVAALQIKRNPLCFAITIGKKMDMHLVGAQGCATVPDFSKVQARRVCRQQSDIEDCSVSGLVAIDQNEVA